MSAGPTEWVLYESKSSVSDSGPDDRIYHVLSSPSARSEDNSQAGLKLCGKMAEPPTSYHLKDHVEEGEDYLIGYYTLTG